MRAGATRQLAHPAPCRSVVGYAFLNGFVSGASA